MPDRDTVIYRAPPHNMGCWQQRTHIWKWKSWLFEPYHSYVYAAAFVLYKKPFCFQRLNEPNFCIINLLYGLPNKKRRIFNFNKPCIWRVIDSMGGSMLIFICLLINNFVLIRLFSNLKPCSLMVQGTSATLIPHPAMNNWVVVN